MNTCFTLLLSSLVFQKSVGYDNFEGLYQLEEPCFDTIHDENCHTSLSEVYSPPYKGVNTNPMNTKLYLFTPTNPDKAEPLHKCGGRLPEDSDFDPDIDTIFIVHGWLDGVCRTAWMREIKEQLFIRGDYNVILVDYTWGNTFGPAEAAKNCLVAGEDIGFVILNIMNQKNVKNGDKFHLIGHSFGTFAVSTAAEQVFLTNPDRRIRRLTLLDPAVAPFTDGDPQKKLPIINAKFVDVIHSDAGDCFPINFGTYAPLGDVDFYPNGGSFQVSCVPYAVTSLLKGDIFYGLGALIFPPICSHTQAIQYFKVSINHPHGRFIGVECKGYEDFILGRCKRCCEEDLSNCAVMGMDSEFFYPDLGKARERNRTFYLDLGTTCPYNEDYQILTC